MNEIRDVVQSLEDEFFVAASVKDKEEMNKIQELIDYLKNAKKNLEKMDNEEPDSKDL